MSFSSRNSYKTPKLVQLESIDTDLSNGIWNVLTKYVWGKYSTNERYEYVEYSNMSGLINRIWEHHFKIPTDEIPEYWTSCLHEIKNKFYGYDWNFKLDFVEFMIAIIEDGTKDKLIESINFHFERENSAYRIINDIVVPISDKHEVEAVDEAVNTSGSFGEVATHIHQALDHLADRDNPDYRNSIKESISAVEAISKKISKKKKATLSSALKTLEKQYGLNPILKEAYTKLYNYSSASDGVRHALMEEADITQDDARFMLVACSAFTNYLTSKYPIQE